MNRIAKISLTLLVATAACAAPAGPDAGRAANAAADVPADTPIGSGPTPAVMEVDPGLPTHTVYHPADLAAAGTLPIVVWGNGACWNAGNSFRWFLSDIASYGYLVIALGPIVKLPMEPTPVPMAPIPAGSPPPNSLVGLRSSATRSSQLIDAINWAIAQNDNAQGRFYHRLNPTQIGVMGQSCGGAQAIEASADPRVRTTVLWNSGLFQGVTTMGGGKPLTKADLDKLHAPIAFISGDAEDLAYANANDDYDRLKHIPALRAYARGMLHSGTYWERNGGEFAGIAVAWLNWQLKGDRRARALFVGADCGLCVNPHWTVRTKRLE